MIPSRNQSNNLDNVPLPKAMLMMRLIWSALLLGQLIAMVIFLVLLPQRHNFQPQPMLPWINLAMLVILVPGAFAFRKMVFRRFRGNNGLPPQVYSTGNLIFWAACEGVSFFGLIIMLVNGAIWPTLGISIFAMGLQALTFPVSTGLASPDAKM